MAGGRGTASVLSNELLASARDFDFTSLSKGSRKVCLALMQAGLPALTRPVRSSNLALRSALVTDVKLLVTMKSLKLSITSSNRLESSVNTPGKQMSAAALVLTRIPNAEHGAVARIVDADSPAILHHGDRHSATMDFDDLFTVHGALGHLRVGHLGDGLEIERLGER
jgi:hypothetical protein